MQLRVAVVWLVGKNIFDDSQVARGAALTAPPATNYRSLPGSAAGRVLSLVRLRTARSGGCTCSPRGRRPWPHRTLPRFHLRTYRTVGGSALSLGRSWLAFLLVAIGRWWGRTRGEPRPSPVATTW